MRKLYLFDVVPSLAISSNGGTFRGVSTGITTLYLSLITTQHQYCQMTSTPSANVSSISDVDGKLTIENETLKSYYYKKLINLHEMVIDKVIGSEQQYDIDEAIASMMTLIDNYETMGNKKTSKYTPLSHANKYSGGLYDVIKPVVEIESFIAPLILEVADVVGSKPFLHLVYDDKFKVYINTPHGMMSLKSLIRSMNDIDDKKIVSKTFSRRLGHITDVVYSYESTRKTMSKNTIDLKAAFDAIVSYHQDYHNRPYLNPSF